jgi:hypothetical protein
LTGERVELEADHVVAERGTVPVDDLYQAAKLRSINAGQLDLAAFARGQPQPRPDRAGEGFELYRIGDASASRDIHTAIYDAYRLCVRL